MRLKVQVCTCIWKWMAAKRAADDGGECLVQHPALSPEWRPLTGGCFVVQAQGLGLALSTRPSIEPGEFLIGAQ